MKDGRKNVPGAVKTPQCFVIFGFEVSPVIEWKDEISEFQKTYDNNTDLNWINK
jgi:hypothetical protein